MTYPIINSVDPTLPRAVRRRRKQTSWQLNDLSAELLADLGVVRQRTGRYAPALLTRRGNQSEPVPPAL